jgi:hypothetical protein
LPFSFTFIFLFCFSFFAYVFLAVGFERFLHGLIQFFNRHWFGHVRVRAERQGLVRGHVSGLGGKHDDRDIFVLPAVAQKLEEVHAADFGHVDIEDDQVRALTGQQGLRGGPCTDEKILNPVSAV